MSSDDSLLSVEQIDTAYGKSQVLRDVSLEVGNGEVVALLGRNGAGKTTTLRSISGVIKPFDGTIVFDGTDITSLPDHEISRLGVSYVAEERAIFPDLTVAENLEMGRVNRDDGVFTIEEVYDLLPRLEERSEQLASHLSGGEQQMLVIARAVVGQTKLLLLDEPTEGLAPQIVEDVLDIIEHVSDQGIPILLVEQNLNAVLEVSDRNYILNKGEIVYEGTTEALQADEETQQQYLGIGASISDEL
ncbi:ABC transporter ATP-binding protein [Haloferax namakaokahaiae]|uniref:ABC transporter ATP-binding protein n=1 Tax=Haloferax namakaokahaiae TaxID=1748331 RepID=A0ABD5ZDK8_9EURY